MLLVEGYAEQVLMPQLAKAHGIDLDKQGISVCAIHGTHFASYVRFCNALAIPWAVLTDGDVDQNGARRGQRRATNLLNMLNTSGTSAEHGIFVGHTTFEYDLLNVGTSNMHACFDTLCELGSASLRATVHTWDGSAPDFETYMKKVDSVGGKGRFAQRLALQSLQPPGYIAAALDYLARE